jgi:hypothetical protein
MSLLFDASARAANLSEKRRKKEKGSWWKDVLKKTVVAGVATPIAETISEGISGVISKPFDNNERLWQEKAQEATAVNRATNSRADNFVSRQDTLEKQGMTPEQARRRVVALSITDEIQAKLAEGETSIEYGGKTIEIGLADLSPDALNVLTNQLADEQIAADDGKFGKQYMKILDNARQRVNENDTQRNKRVNAHNRLSKNVFGKAINIVRGKTKEDLLEKSLSSLRNSQVFQDNAMLANDFAEYDKTRGVKEGINVLNQAAVNEAVGKLSLKNFEKKPSAVPGTHTLREGGDGPRRKYNGMWVRKYNSVTGESSQTFTPHGEGILTSEDSYLFDQTFNYLDKELTRINNAGVKGNAFINQLAEQFPGYNIFNLGASMNEEGSADSAGRTKLYEAANFIANETTEFNTNRDNLTPTYTELEKTSMIEFHKGWGAKRAALVSKLGSEVDPVEKDNLILELKKVDLESSQIANALRAGLVSSDSGVIVPVGHMIKKGEDENVTYVVSPDATMSDGVTPITNGQAFVNREIHKLWNEERRLLSPEQKETVYKSVADADMSVVDSIQKTKKIKETKRLAAANNLLGQELFEEINKQNLMSESETVEKLTDNQINFMAKAFPENNVDVGEVFPAVVKQLFKFRNQDIQKIRKEMWVEAPSSETGSRMGNILTNQLRGLTYPVKEIYYNFLKPFSIVADGTTAQIVQEIGSIWKASTEAITNEDVSFMHRANQIHTVLELKAERPDVKEKISEAAKKLFLIKPQIETEELKQGIANFVFGSDLVR